MRRRDFIKVIGSAVAASPLAARAQQPERVRRIGVLMAIAEGDADAQSRVRAFEQELRELGWTADRNVRIDYRWAAGDADRTRDYAAELVRLHPDVIFGVGTFIMMSLRHETRTIPIVFVQVSDPIGQGFVESLARPGGNVTGFTLFEFSVVGKWLGMLKDVAPRIARVALMFNRETAPYAGLFLQPFEAAAQTFAVEPITADVRDDQEIERTIETLGKSDGSLIVLPDAFTTEHRELIVAMAAQHHVTAIYPFRYFAASGGLISYGIDSVDSYRRAASYVDRILRGTKPADLPVQQPTKFELVINLKTAKALGVTVPPSLLARADEVIE